MLVNVIGDVMMTAGVVAYLGAFTVRKMTINGFHNTVDMGL